MSNQPPELPPAFVELLKRVKGKRSRVVVDHILQYGYITTEALEKNYGYKHPPRAIRDVREQGIPIETFSTKDEQGRTIAAYRFGDTSALIPGRIGGRRSFPRALKDTLISASHSRCAICGYQYEERYLQIDHRIPYEISGNPTEITSAEHYMLLCGSCNRSKSWSCEQCENWKTIKKTELCRSCYWANPEFYEHLAMQHIRRLDLVWQPHEIAEFEELQRKATENNMSVAEYIKLRLKDTDAV